MYLCIVFQERARPATDPRYTRDKDAKYNKWKFGKLVPPYPSSKRLNSLVRRHNSEDMDYAVRNEKCTIWAKKRK